MITFEVAAKVMGVVITDREQRQLQRRGAAGQADGVARAEVVRECLLELPGLLPRGQEHAAAHLDQARDVLFFEVVLVELDFHSLAPSPRRPIKGRPTFTAAARRWRGYRRGAWLP
jgi:hypothetical protein